MTKPRSYPTPRVATNDARDASLSPVVHTRWNPVEFSAADMAEARAGYDALLLRREDSDSAGYPVPATALDHTIAANRGRRAQLPVVDVCVPVRDDDDATGYPIP